MSNAKTALLQTRAALDHRGCCVCMCVYVRSCRVIGSISVCVCARVCARVRNARGPRLPLARIVCNLSIFRAPCSASSVRVPRPPAASSPPQDPILRTDQEEADSIVPGHHHQLAPADLQSKTRNPKPTWHLEHVLGVGVAAYGWKTPASKPARASIKSRRVQPDIMCPEQRARSSSLLVASLFFTTHPALALGLIPKI